MKLTKYDLAHIYPIEDIKIKEAPKKKSNQPGAKPVVYKGCVFDSIGDLDRYKGLNPGTLASRIRKLGSVEEAVDRPIDKEKSKRRNARR